VRRVALCRRNIQITQIPGGNCILYVTDNIDAAAISDGSPLGDGAQLSDRTPLGDGTLSSFIYTAPFGRGCTIDEMMQCPW